MPPIIHILCVGETFPEIETRLICFFGFGPGVHLITSLAGKPSALRQTNDGRVNSSECGSKAFSFRRKELGGRESLSWAQLHKQWLAALGDGGRRGPWSYLARGGWDRIRARRDPAGLQLCQGAWAVPQHPPFQGSFLKCKTHPVFPYKTLFTTTLFPCLIS